MEIKWTYLFQFFTAIAAVFSQDSGAPLDLSPLIDDAKDWAQNNNLAWLTKKYDKGSGYTQIAPFTLFPSPVPKKLFQQAYDVQKAMQLLYFRIGQDRQFLLDTFADMLNSGEKSYMSDMLQIHEEILNEGGPKQPITLFYARSDYMFHDNNKDGAAKDYELKQVEINLGNLGATGMMERTAKLHRRMLWKANIKLPEENLPKNEPAVGFGQALVHAWKLFGDPNSIMLIIRGQDTRHVEYEAEKITDGKLKIVYLSSAECPEKLRLDDDYNLWIDHYKIGVVYFRDGYSKGAIRPPKHIYEAFRNIHRSTAIKCPTVIAEIVSSKKVQQVLSQPGMVERFFPKSDEAANVAAIRATFAKMWALDKGDEKTAAVVQDAIDNPDRYVLKSMGEGGGNNYFGEQIPEKLRTFTPAERSAHILMEMLYPMKFKNYMVKAFKDVELGEMVTELGIYGYIIANARDSRVLHNHAVGHLMRSKLSHLKEGGISHGVGVCDTPLLF